MMRTSQALEALVRRLQAAGMAEEASLLAGEAARVRGVEAALDAVLEGMAEPIVFPARRLRGPRPDAEAQAQAAD